MVALVIFWSALLAILFFVLGIIFKALASGFNALFASIELVLALGGLGSLTGFVLYLLYVIIDGIVKEGFLAVVGTIVLFLIVVGFVAAIIGGLGALILEIAVVLAVYALTITSRILEWVSALCERMYGKYLRIIKSQLEKC